MTPISMSETVTIHVVEIDLADKGGPASVAVILRDLDEYRCFGGDPLVYVIRSTRTPAEFVVDGHPYGGTFEMSPGGDATGGSLYRAGCFGRPAHELGEEMRAAVAAAMLPHAPAVEVAVQAHAKQNVVAVVAHRGREVERLRAELAAAERGLDEALRLACTAHGLDVPPDTCDDSVDDEPEQS